MADKPNDNSPVTSSETDVFPGSLGERQYRSYRYDPTRHRGVALAVVGSDGASISGGMEARIDDLLYELRALRVAMMWAGTAADLHDGVENTV